MRGIFHHGMTVRKLENSIKFYQDMLGAEVVVSPTDVFEGPELSKAVNVNEAKLRLAVIAVGGDEIELLEYVHPGSPMATPIPPQMVGAMHISFQVENVKEKVKQLQATGVAFHSAPNAVTEGPLNGWNWVYFTDPDGITVELVEYNPTNGRTATGVMKKRSTYYRDLVADYSKPQRVPKSIGDQLIAASARFINLKERSLPSIGPDYTLEQIEEENKAWWPTHCEALRRGRGDLLTAEYHENLVYFCQDGPYYGLDEQKSREQHWWALIAQPGVTMSWPIVMFHGEFVWFEWACVDDETHETIAKGSVAWIRRGHRGGCYFKGEQLTFYRDVFAPAEAVKQVPA